MGLITKTKIQSPQPLQINSDEEDGWGGDIRLSIVEQWENDSAFYYKAISTHEGKELGFITSVPKKKGSEKGFAVGLELQRSGVESDHLLHVLAMLYKQKPDTGTLFVSKINVAYINITEFAKSVTGVEPENSNAQEYKIFFEGSTEDQHAELFLNIYPTEKWLELREKDEEYRQEILRFLTQPSKI